MRFALGDPPVQTRDDGILDVVVGGETTVKSPIVEVDPHPGIRIRAEERVHALKGKTHKIGGRIKGEYGACVEPLPLGARSRGGTPE